MKSIYRTLTYFLAAGILFGSCQKKEDDENETGIADDNAFASVSFNDLESMADEAAKGTLESFKTESTEAILTSCATITHDTVSSPRVLTIDFGNANCLCRDGRYRRGKVIVHYTGHYFDTGYTHTITTDHYFVNDHQVTGTKTITNKGKNGNGNVNWDISVDGQVILSNGLGTITWTSERNREIIGGEDTEDWLDDVYLITGTANGTGARGREFDVVITNPLKVVIGCRHFVSGSFDLTPKGRKTIHVDYGDGQCDHRATATIGKRTYKIFLR